MSHTVSHLPSVGDPRHFRVLKQGRIELLTWPRDIFRSGLTVTPHHSKAG